MNRVSSLIKNYTLPILISLITITWILLYRHFIFGHSYYLYNDVGNDTVVSYWPYYKFITNLIKLHAFNSWSFNLGTGNDVFSLFLLLFDPFIFILLIPGISLPSLILFSTYVKTICIAVLFYKYLKLFNRDDHISLIICTILFSFNSFIIIWGQHYFFLTGVFYFIFLLYGVEYFFKYSRATLLFVSLVFFLCGSLYCLFFSLPFFFVYIVYRLLQDKDIKANIFNSKLKIILVILFSVLLSSWSILPILNVLNSSPRTLVSFNYQLFYSVREILVNISRFYNVIWLGVNDYHGNINFYEDRQVYVSCLFPLLLLPFVLNDKKRILIKLILVTLCFLPLVFPFGDALFNKFSALSTRYSFFYAVIEILVIRDVLKKRINKKNLVVSLFINMIVILVLGWNLDLYHLVSFYLVISFILIYTFLLIVKTRSSAIILLFVIVLEILYFNNIAVFSSRSTININNITNHSIYFDGTNEVSEWVNHNDNSFYRLYRNYVSNFMNDSAYFGYNGFDTYNSLNSPYYNKFRNSFNIDNGYLDEMWKVPEWSTINNGMDHQIFLYSFLSAKYFISKRGYHQVPYGYIKLKEFNGYTLYKNKMFLPVGVFYESNRCTNQDDYISANNDRKEYMLANSYITGSCAQLSVKNESDIVNKPLRLENNDIKNYSLQESIDYISKVKHVFITFSNVESYVEMKLHFNINKAPNQDVVNKSITAYIKLLNYPYNEQDKVKFDLDKFGNADIYLEFDNIKSIRMSIDDVANSLESINISKQYLLQYEANIKDLKSRSVDFKYNIEKPNIFYINKYFLHDGIIILPVPFNKYWHVEVNGQLRTAQLVDNGLLGVFVNKGNNSVKIYYRNDAFLLGAFISITSLLLIALFLGFNKIREVYNNKSKTKLFN